MKRTIILLFVIVCLFNSCRKGKEDPFLSLRTRTNRLTGKWNLESSIGNITVKYANDKNVDYQYYHNKKNDNSFRYKKLEEYTNGYYIEFENYQFILSIDKKGNTSSSTVINSECMNYSNTTDGTWRWLNKKKELYFTQLNIAYGDLINKVSDKYDDQLKFELSENIIEKLRTFTVTRLTNKELKLVINYKATLNNQEIKYINAYIEFKFIKVFD